MKQIANNYSFDASEGKVTIQGLNIPQSRLLLIVNASRNQILYNFSGGAGVEDYALVGGNTVATLSADTTGFSDNDALTIYYDDGLSREEVATITDLQTVAGAAPADWLRAGSVPVAGGALGLKEDSAADSTSGNWGLIALAKGILAQVFDKFPAKTTNGRIPVDIGGNGAITITSGTVTVANEVEIKNTVGSPVPVRSGEGSLNVVSKTTLQTSDEALASSSDGRRYLFVQNLSSAPIFINFGAPATTSSIRLDAGSSLVYESLFVPTNAVNVLGASAGQNYVVAFA